MFPSVVLRSFGTDFATSLKQAAELGFAHVDIVAEVQRPEQDREALAESGLIVACAALGRDLPDGHTLDAGDVGVRRVTLDAIKRQVDDVAGLGATHAYLVPGLDAMPSAFDRFRDALSLLAEHAADRRVVLCLEHFPGKALPTIRDTLAFIESVKHANLRLLLDLGHAQISQEGVPERGIGYVHANDNDGKRDLHLPLFAGKLTEEGLRQSLADLGQANYRGAVSLELNPENPQPDEGVRVSKIALDRLLSARKPDA